MEETIFASIAYLLRYSRPSSLYNFSLDVPLIGLVIARVALY